jgi:hypothetical protein
MHEQELTPQLEAFAAQLAALRPATGLSRERLLFEAGRAAADGERSSIPWRTVWPALTLAAGVSALLLGRFTAPVAYQPIYTYAEREIPAQTAEATPSIIAPGLAAADSYLRLREQLADVQRRPSPRFRDSEIPSPIDSRSDLLQQLLN